MTAPRVVGLDLALTKSGVALPDGTTHVLRPATSGCDRLIWIRDAVLLACGVDAGKHISTQPLADVVAVEGFFQGIKGDSALKLAGIGWIVRVALHEAGIPYAVVDNKVLKRYATGKGGGPGSDKFAMVAAAAKRLGYATDAPKDDEADALWLRALALDAYGHPVCPMPKAQRDAAVNAVTWPTLEAVTAA